MAENTHEQIDDLFVKIRLLLLQVREHDEAIAGDLKSLLTQLEDCVESIVMDSLRLKSLESKPQNRAEAEKRRTPARDRKKAPPESRKK